MTLLVPDSPARGQPAYQVGLGNSLSTAEPCEVYVPLTGFSISPVSPNLIINPAGTLATGTVIFPSNPADGQKLSITSSQTQTALTCTAATGDSIVSTASALVAATPVVFRYSLYGTGVGVAGTNPRTWFRSA
jgi:hypothetical protein